MSAGTVGVQQHRLCGTRKWAQGFVYAEKITTELHPQPLPSQEFHRFAHVD